MQSSLIDVLLITVEKIGVDTTRSLLLKAQQELIVFEDKVIEKVILCICDKMKITPEELVYGVGRKNNRKMAIGFCFFYLTEIYKYKPDSVAHILNKNNVNCWKYKKMVQRLSAKHPADTIYIELKNYFNNIFIKQ